MRDLITGISCAKRCREVIDKLAWCEQNPVAVRVTEWNFRDKKRVSDFHNRLTSGSHL